MKLPAELKVEKFEKLSSILMDGVDIIVAGVSSIGIEWFVEQISKYYKKKRIFLIYLLKISLSKRPSESATMQAIAASPVTLTDVRSISSILSTARIIPIASSGRPNC